MLWRKDLVQFYLFQDFAEVHLEKTFIEDLIKQIFHKKYLIGLVLITRFEFSLNEKISNLY